MILEVPEVDVGGEGVKKDSAVPEKSVPGREFFGRQIREELSVGRFHRRFIGRDGPRPESILRYEQHLRVDNNRNNSVIRASVAFRSSLGWSRMAIRDNGASA